MSRTLSVEVVSTPEAIAASPPVAGAAAPSLALLRLRPPSCHLVVRDVGAPAEPRARASLWWDAGPTLDGRRTGRIGHYAATDDHAAAALLDAALATLRAHGAAVAVGPMDGSTWFGYRFVTDRRGALATPPPPFVLEPDQPDDWPRQWRAHGFAPLAHYTSTVVDDLAPRASWLDTVRARLAAAGITLRTLDAAHFDTELDRIHRVATEAFAHAFLYEPVDRATVHALYGGARALVVPSLVLLAERGDEPVGFAFTLPDAREAARTGHATTVVVKTVAVRPLPEARGLGTLLVEETHARAAALGFTRAVHATMHDDNRSRAISARHGVPMRGYTLFARPLDDGRGDDHAR